MPQRYYSSTAGDMALTGGVDSTNTSITVDTVAGLPVSTPFTLVLDVDQEAEEVVTVTGVAGTVLTVIRGEDGTAAQSHTTGAVVRHMVTARDLRESQQHMDTAVAHGATSALVGKDDVQTLTNKSLSGAENTFTAIPQTAVTGVAEHVASTEVHGATGAVVGTTNTQTLTNKTLTAPVITSPPTNVANPAGVVVMTAASSAPSGWLLCQGQAVSRVTYADLFAAIGTSYGAGDGSTTFNVPDLKGRVPVGLDSAQTEFDALGETGGAKTHTLTTAEMPSHSHDIAVGYGGNAVNAARVSGNDTGGTGVTPAIWSSPVQPSGGGGAHNNLQPYVVLNFIIKT